MSVEIKRSIPNAQKIEHLCRVFRAAVIASDEALARITEIELRAFGVSVPALRTEKEGAK